MSDQRKQIVERGRRLFERAWTSPRIDFFARYNSPRKLANLVRAKRAMARRDELLHGIFPTLALIEPANVCNLSCPGCPTGRGDEDTRRKGLLDPATLQRVLDEVGDYLYSVQLFNWGEPLLNKKLPELVAMSHARGIGTVVHTNFSVPLKEDFLERVVASGLDYLILSIDGATQDTYEVYRRGGKLALVLDNIRTVVRLRRKLRQSRPRIVWKFLEFDHDRHEIQAARRLARDLGILFRVDHGAQWSEQLGLTPERRAQRQPIDSCNWLYDRIVVDHDGAVMPCCLAASERDVVYDIHETSYLEGRNAANMVSSRRMFREARVPDQWNTCVDCPAFKPSWDTATAEEIARREEGRRRPAAAPTALQPEHAE